MSEQKSKESLITLNLGRKALGELLKGATGFGFLAIAGVLFQSLDFKFMEYLAKTMGNRFTPDQIQQALTGVATPLNAAIGSALESVAKDKDLNLKMLIAYKLNIQLEQAAVLVDYNKKLMIDIEDGKYTSIDPKLFIKKPLLIYLWNKYVSCWTMKPRHKWQFVLLYKKERRFSYH